MNTKTVSHWLKQNLPVEPIQGNDDYPQISIITPCYNSETFLEQTIRSVILQSCPNLEYIIIDGGSMDGTVDIIKQYERWISYWVSEKDAGQSEAINKGIRQAKGEWVAWINADDIYLPNAINTVIEFVKNRKEVSWVVGSTIYIDSDFNVIGRFIPELYSARGFDPKYQKMGWLDFVCSKRSGIALPQPSSFWKREAIIKVGYLDETLQYTMDHELYGRLARRGLYPEILGNPLACFRIHASQKTSKYLSGFYKEERKIVQKIMPEVGKEERTVLRNYDKWFNYFITRQKIKKQLYKVHLIIKRIFFKG